MLFAPSILRNENVLDDFFNDNFWPVTTNFAVMKTDIKETDNGYEVEMNLPGFTKEDVHAELKDGYLTVTAQHSENKDQKDEKNERYIRRERYSGHYQRSFYLGDQYQEGDIKANFRNGVLTMEIPKKEEKPQVEEGKTISIEG